MSASDLRIKPEGASDFHKIDEEVPACNLTGSTESKHKKR